MGYVRALYGMDANENPLAGNGSQQRESSYNANGQLIVQEVTGFNNTAGYSTFNNAIDAAGNITQYLTKHGPGQSDGTAFVIPKAEADALIAASRGNPRALEQALGLPSGQLDHTTLMRVDFAKPGELGLRMPSGNEVGANSQWIPGGKLPGGLSEAVVDVNIPAARYSSNPILIKRGRP